MVKFSGPGALGKEQGPFPFYYIKRVHFRAMPRSAQWAVQPQNCFWVHESYLKEVPSCQYEVQLKSLLTEILNEPLRQSVKNIS